MLQLKVSQKFVVQVKYTLSHTFVHVPDTLSVIIISHDLGDNIFIAGGVSFTFILLVYSVAFISKLLDTLAETV
ncbi:MAG: hypothetical protein Q8S84_07805 [bacterium]|nr:hypothetical protein [bacterium]MDP3381343.1 hypothetical protein [bacterium]